MLEAAGLGAVRGERRLFRGLNLSLAPGELLYVHGPNGSGKTTLLRMVCGLVAPAEGEIRWDGSPIGELGEDYRRILLYLGHAAALKDELSALENLRIMAALGGTPVTESQALDALDALGLGGCEDLPVRVLSQGQKRRAALARLYLSKARLWVLDEPFTALDKASVAGLEDILAAHLAGGGIVVLTTHQEVGLTAAVSKEIALGS
ncbi:MAG TPA: cytochrome c biogenesis heme-transporting ATPase CcmA [Gammaproteobacteria bacterium]|nr:cytochrome c biogenesis heme-transporting ATPase CcmA [Gammaproteobacteria bacterium]